MKRLILFLIILIQSCSSIGDVTSLKQAQEMVDIFMDDLQSEYVKLCNGPRNDSQKKKFSYLGAEISILFNISEKAVNLDYELQSKLTDYVMRKFDSNYPELKELGIYSKVECW